MEKAIVTGANGFIGSAVTKVLIENGIEVLAMDRRECQVHIPKVKAVQFCPMELENMTELEKEIQKNSFDTFYHFAWMGSAGNMRGDVKKQLDNVQYTVEAVHLAKKLGCRRFIGAGSIMEHESIKTTLAQQNHPSRGSIYSIAKYTAHGMAKTICAAEEMEFIWPMITNAYGPGEQSERFINTYLRSLFMQEPLALTSGEQLYDFIYITDVAYAFYLAGMKGRDFSNYTIGSGNARPLKEFISIIHDWINPSCKLRLGERKEQGESLQPECFDVGKLMKDTGFIPKVSFEEGILITARWMKENMRKRGELL